MLMDESGRIRPKNTRQKVDDALFSFDGFSSFVVVASGGMRCVADASQKTARGKQTEEKRCARVAKRVKSPAQKKNGLACAPEGGSKADRARRCIFVGDDDAAAAAAAELTGLAVSDDLAPPLLNPIECSGPSSAQGVIERESAAVVYNARESISIVIRL